MVSFGVVSLFANVLLDEAIDIIIKLEEKEMRVFLYLCNKNVYFSLKNKMSFHVDGVSMGSVLANTFMVELEQNIIPVLANGIS